MTFRKQKEINLALTIWHLRLIVANLILDLDIEGIFGEVHSF